MAQINGVIPGGGVVRTIELPSTNEPRASSSATLQLRDTGDLVLYCVDAGFPVWMQIAEDCTSWEQWYTVPAAEVPTLSTDVGAALEAVRDALAGAGKAGSGLVSPFLAWLKSRGARHDFAERINYYD